MKGGKLHKRNLEKIWRKNKYYKDSLFFFNNDNGNKFFLLKKGINSE